jgi:hypothetical protein
MTLLRAVEFAQNGVALGLGHPGSAVADEPFPMCLVLGFQLRNLGLKRADTVLSIDQVPHRLRGHSRIHDRLAPQPLSVLAHVSRSIAGWHGYASVTGYASSVTDGYVT